MLHIAVLMKPYLEAVLDGRKTVECRLTRQPRPPFECIEPGDRIYFKQSAGPFRATAVADHVICESDLTRTRVREIKRDYNNLILGDDQFWDWKRDSLYCTLIWLRAVEPIEVGPGIRPLQGLAWLVLDHREKSPSTTHDGSSARSPRREPAPAGCFEVEITPGNLKNSTLYVGSVLERFPAAVVGGATMKQLGQCMTLILDGGQVVLSDIVGPKRMIRKRVWGEWFRRLEAQPGDRVVFTPAGESTYFVGLARRRAPNRTGVAAAANRLADVQR
jgi:ASC-1-like (ASCH) protein